MVVMVVGLIVALITAGLIVDGGNAWSQQRIVQNGSDAAAEAGAIVMAQKFAGANPTQTLAQWDTEVEAAIEASATANGIALAGAYYTDICGIPLAPDGSKALHGDGSYDLGSAAQVGANEFPQPATSTAPDCPALTVGPPAGVLVFGQKSVETYLAGVIGMTSINVTTQATAVSGYLQGTVGPLLPVTFPVDPITCSHGDPTYVAGGSWTTDTVYILPLCGTANGNVGWLDWDVQGGGGASEVVNEILCPDNPAIQAPWWGYVAQAGNINGGGGNPGDPCNRGYSVEEALNTYSGQVVLIPLFDQTCGVNAHQAPDQDNVSNSTANYGCLDASTNKLGGNGQSNWYRLASFAYFQLCSSDVPGCATLNATQGAYIQGSNPNCESGQGQTGCLIGRFVDVLSSGAVGAGVGGGTGSNKAVGVQLIK